MARYGLTLRPLNTLSFFTVFPSLKFNALSIFRKIITESVETQRKQYDYLRSALLYKKVHGCFEHSLQSSLKSSSSLL